MRFKYYLRGLGLGIIFSVIILSINSKNNRQDLSDTQIMEKASELGMVMSPEDKETDEEKENNKNNTQETTENQGLQEESSQISETSDDSSLPSEIPDSSETANNTPANDVISTDTPAEPISITVEIGENCRSIAHKIQSAGLISDAEDFRIYMGKKGIANYIKTGTHEIPVGASYDEIANILTN